MGDPEGEPAAELLAAREIRQETVRYISNVYKYYVAYKLVTERENAKPPTAG